ncbi:MAG TPA: 1,2-phenylacetyl-CoA epoxidase subunit PaaC [Saprospiraceae bacterium]|nr:1,2-phenylacetyl-CoA epoxidase subunit PaaC [Saprospiraceae bacterium]
MKTTDALYQYCLRLGDNNLIMAQRLAEWCSRGPFLEEDLAITNISLDLFGQAETLYTYAASLKGDMTPDTLAFHRNERQYLNTLLVEQPNGDFAQTMVKIFLYASYCRYLYTALLQSHDETLKGFAAKAIKETKYHIRHSSEWIVRFGLGTHESRERAQKAIEELWRFAQDLFEVNEVDDHLISFGITSNPEDFHGTWLLEVSELLQEAGLTKPDVVNVIKGGYQGIHTEHLGHLLTEMQYLQRAYPDASW